MAKTNMLLNSVRTVCGLLLPTKRLMRLLEVLAGGTISNMCLARGSPLNVAASDVQCRKLLEYLTTRAMRILQVPARPWQQGPKPATRREFLEALPLFSPNTVGVLVWPDPVPGVFAVGFIGCESKIWEKIGLTALLSFDARLARFWSAS